MNIYQLFPRLFGNKKHDVKFNGEKTENGCGTFADIDDIALHAIHSLGFTHIWLTGILRHATQGENHPDITKGKAGSPYAVTDYYAVDPDLGTLYDLNQLIGRIHGHGMKVIMDFIPNHVARECKGFEDCNFYICEGQAFVPPTGNGYKEFPARASGNDIFAPNPSINDWYDTVKLNYNNHDTWEKMFSILKYWSGMNIDGFRVDMAEMVPVKFWEWVIPKIKESLSSPIFIAEIYQPSLYKPFIDAGFDYLYDKVGLYNTLENIIRFGQRAESISQVWKDLNGLDSHMLRFMENHDEIRLASSHFVGDPFAALPSVAISALMNTGPFMVYNGQENGEDALHKQGYSGDDGRTSIFDYTTMPKHQLWMNEGSFDHGKSNDRQQRLFSFYSSLLNLRESHPAIKDGAFYDLMWCNPWYNHFDPQYAYAFLRYHGNERLLIVVNFNQAESRDLQIAIPDDALQLMKMKEGELKENPIHLHLSPCDVNVIDLQTFNNLISI